MKIGTWNRRRILIVAIVTTTLFASHAGMPEPAMAVHLCFQPIDVPFPEDDERRAQLEDAISSILTDAGFTLTPSAAVKVMMDRVNTDFGAIVDPISGRVVPTDLARFKDELANGFHKELGCAARVFVSLVVVKAPFYSGVVEWDGSERSVISPDATALDELAALDQAGWVSALSIWISFLDPWGVDLGFRSAGIEPLVHLGFSRAQDQLPRDQWLRDTDRLSRALRSALRPHGRPMRLSYD